MSCQRLGHVNIIYWHYNMSFSKSPFIDSLFAFFLLSNVTSTNYMSIACHPITILIINYIDILFMSTSIAPVIVLIYRSFTCSQSDLIDRSLCKFWLCSFCISMLCFVVLLFSVFIISSFFSNLNSCFELSLRWHQFSVNSYRSPLDRTLTRRQSCLFYFVLHFRILKATLS